MPVRLPCESSTEIVRWLCDVSVFWSICVLNMYNYTFLTEMTLQKCLTRFSIRQRHKLTQSMTSLIRRPYCSISVRFYWPRAATVWGLYDYGKSLWSESANLRPSRTGPVRVKTNLFVVMLGIIHTCTVLRDKPAFIECLTATQEILVRFAAGAKVV